MSQKPLPEYRETPQEGLLPPYLPEGASPPPDYKGPALDIPLLRQKSPIAGAPDILVPEIDLTNIKLCPQPIEGIFAMACSVPVPEKAKSR